jgi:hypothetical protein
MKQPNEKYIGNNPNLKQWKELQDRKVREEFKVYKVFPDQLEHEEIKDSVDFRVYRVLLAQLDHKVLSEMQATRELLAQLDQKVKLEIPVVLQV